MIDMTDEATILRIDNISTEKLVIHMEQLIDIIEYLEKRSSSYSLYPPNPGSIPDVTSAYTELLEYVKGILRDRNIDTLLNK